MYLSAFSCCAKTRLPTRKKRETCLNSLLREWQGCAVTIVYRRQRKLTFARTQPMTMASVAQQAAMKKVTARAKAKLLAVGTSLVQTISPQVRSRPRRVTSLKTKFEADWKCLLVRSRRTSVDRGTPLKYLIVLEVLPVRLSLGVFRSNCHLAPRTPRATSACTNFNSTIYNNKK